VKPNYNIESKYYIEMPKWERKTAKEAKSRKPQNEEDGLQTSNRLWLDETASSSENTWALCILDKIYNKKEDYRTLF